MVDALKPAFIDVDVLFRAAGTVLAEAGLQDGVRRCDLPRQEMDDDGYTGV